MRSRVCLVSRCRAALSVAGYSPRRQLFRVERARAAGAADARKAALLSKWWHTRRGLQWPDIAVMGVTGAAVLYAAAALRGARRRGAALAEATPPADAPT